MSRCLCACARCQRWGDGTTTWACVCVCARALAPGGRWLGAGGRSAMAGPARPGPARGGGISACCSLRGSGPQVRSARALLAAAGPARCRAGVKARPGRYPRCGAGGRPWEAVVPRVLCRAETDDSSGLGPASCRALPFCAGAAASSPAGARPLSAGLPFPGRARAGGLGSGRVC